ncbi:motility protein A [Roseiconus lacunae]|uniref:MotA/TolQ/ExbB proton channel family protein n=1 Tax=Roseiconus lacunae TaxID=2605694 RepID=A0ABT7PDE0_9BACT|nr:MotA/TolQ/ExbB proton channel family protein [Roseiconus lacunae]MCD0459822.1 MotA/TolQ/ExbB proton channel family protein [Roseiconus lacunae]MDM4014520.1 MotA/TolQ/ExbB proton channel family protein [Roseiconus lacunae]WRQ49833.1 MotA/TolQ/ExbB proton channel family protein [Stieleria sp. HD01]
MDIATIIGLILGGGLILTAIALGGGGLTPFIDVPSGMIVFGGAIAASLINFPLKMNLGAFSVILKTFMFKLPSPQDTIGQFKKFAEVVRKDGLLALEEQAAAVTDDYMKRGLESLISGVAAEDVARSLEIELSYIEQRHVAGKKIVDSAGAAAPAFGMIGTLIGLVQMLRSLDDPSQIGGGMAVALLTTLYGALVANVVCIPLAGKLEARNQEESMIRELMICGITLLGEGESPRVVEEKLLSFLSPKTRKSIVKA